jgi:maleylacetate reductase
LATQSFTMRDGERTIRFGEGSASEAPGLLRQAGFAAYTLLTTERAAGSAPLEPAARLDVPPGLVDEISASLLPEAGERPLVALGGGRVIDTAKAIGGVTGAPVAAIPTTLSGAELTPFHRTPKDVAGARLVRPALVIADPELMASQPPEALAASALNALAHAMEALYTPLANPVSTMAALRAAALLATDDRESLALGAVLAGYASGSTGIAVHHALCQTIVREAGTPHAETNAVMLPHSARLMEPRAPEALRAFREALPVDLSALAARCGHTRLGSLGVAEQQLAGVAETVAAHPYAANTPDPPGADELLAVLRAAL